MMRPSKTTKQVITEAVHYFAAGNISASQIPFWLSLLRDAVMRGTMPEEESRAHLTRTLTAAFRKMTKPENLRERIPAVKAFTIQMVAPELRGELERKILESANLIKLKREAAIETTLARFQGWMSSVPPGGTAAASTRKVVADILKPTAQEKYETRRVTIDQTHKLISNIAAVVAKENSAIAAVWRSHWRDPGYNYRPDHKERDKKIYAIRGNWALTQGLMKAGPAGYLDDITQPGEEPYCSCWVRYITRLEDLPPDMLTNKGMAEVGDE